MSFIAPLLFVALAGPPEMGALVIEGGAPGTPVTVDGQPVGALPLPGPWTLPAGDHAVQVGDAQHRVKVSAGQRAELNLGGAKAAPGKPAAPVPVDPEVIVRHVPGFPLAKAGYGAAGLGVALLGAAVYFGLDADDLASQARDLDRRDPSVSRADQHDLASDAEHQAFVANVLYGAGGVLLAGGAALILLGSDGPLAVAPSPGGVVVGGAVLKPLIALALIALAGCAPELPNRACTAHSDCFTQEVCVQKQCVTARPAADVDAEQEDAGLPDVAPPGSTDGGADAVP